ncbi:rhodanese-like domain-containing protein [Desulfatitalea alkaliphila]|uniref:Sulfurtransferase n=1 Tax=Desulfatitalea alkaliphila TaxID=2929485 RepID=A0AA41UR19_9BACT|nr:rhodanese-like domain-containing protein [Desulfatitalea alkaliphila]MCJ8501913.1 sulfurtransferase [Desulfatitalea alkaliphila]
MSTKPISPEALRRYIQEHKEKHYLLVDVRQPEEYRQGHIPGASLIPLPQLVQDMEQLPADKELIFYCHVGGRSMAAAAMVEEEGREGSIYNLTGGIAAWDGERVPDMPRLKLFAGQASPEAFRTAMDLEKGAQIFYQSVGERYPDRSWATVFARLAKAERAHAKAVHGFWRQAQPELEDFDTLYDAMAGDILEGGTPLREALDKLQHIGDDPFLRLIEVALQIEYAAFDLYRVLADQHQETAVQEAFISLAQSEKAHMQSLIAALDNQA